MDFTLESESKLPRKKRFGKRKNAFFVSEASGKAYEIRLNHASSVKTVRPNACALVALLPASAPMTT